MAIALPTPPKEADIKERYLYFGGVLKPSLGGPVMQIPRLGDRYALDISLPVQEQADARPWIAALKKSLNLGQTLTVIWPQKAFAGGIGAPLVNGAGQSGSALAVKGLTAGVTIKADQPFSFVAGGRHYLHTLSDDAVADGTGHATLAISPMLRASPADSAALELASPVLEGFLDGPTLEWVIQRLRLHQVAQFTIAENA